MKKHQLGNIVIAILVVVNPILWLVITPENTLDTNYVLQVIGEIIASTVMILIALGLVLAARPRFLEPYFGGLDKMWKTHKNISILAFLLVIVHFFSIPKTTELVNGKPIGMLAFFGIVVLVLVTIAPRVPFLSRLLRFNYTRWRIVHKLMGVFYILGLVHYLTVGTLSKQTIPGLYMLLFSVIGIMFYLYRQFISRMFEPYRPHEVEKVERLNGKTVEVTLKPTGKPINYQAGQFAYVAFSPGRELREPHPFTISSAPGQDRLRFTIKNSGDWTGFLCKNLSEGQKAMVHGGFGEFNFRAGKKGQVWIAGGIGITPFLSWVRDTNGTSDYQVNLFYAARNATEAVFWDELESAAQARDWFDASVRYSSEDGNFSIDEIIQLSGGDITQKDIYLCGPVRMTEAFSSALRSRGVPSSQIHFEEFNFR